MEHEPTCHPDCSQPQHLWPESFDEGGQLISEAPIPFHGSMKLAEQLLQIQSTPAGRQALMTALGLHV